MYDKSCPLCASKDLSNVKRFKLIESAEHIIGDNQEDLKKIVSYMSKNIYKNDNIDFLKCHNCELEFADPFKAADSYLYNILYKESTLSKSFWKWDFEIAYQYIRQQTRIGIKSQMMSFLDIGAGSGHFLKKVKTEVTNSKCYAVEYSKNCRIGLEELGIEAHHSLEQILNSHDEISFDYISLFQVLEHIDNFDFLFENLKKILAKKNGKIIITTPNSLQRRYYDSFNIFEDVPPVHVSRFTETSFLKIAEKYNLELVDYRIEQGSFLRNCVRFMNTKYKNMPFLNFLRKLPFGRYLLLLPFIPLALFNLRALAGLRLEDMGTSQIAIYQLKV